MVNITQLQQEISRLGRRISGLKSSPGRRFEPETKLLIANLQQQRKSLQNQVKSLSAPVSGGIARSITEEMPGKLQVAAQSPNISPTVPADTNQRSPNLTLPLLVIGGLIIFGGKN